jgi:hypothetical protein
VNVVQQLPALIGVVVGALGSFLVSSATESRRWRRQQSTRWDEKRAQAYAEYGFAVKNVFSLCWHISNFRGLGPMAEKIDLTEALNELRLLNSERSVKWESVLLLGNPETVDAARRWHRLVGKVEIFVREGHTDVSEWDALFDEVNVARDRFYDAARYDLGIRSGHLPPWGRWNETQAGPSDESSSSL